jgi:hypothetical protein
MLTTLRNLLQSLGTCQLILQQMTNRAVASSVSLRIKDASALFTSDYVNVADYIDEAIGYADDLTADDVTRLRAVSRNLRNANQHLQLTQNLLTLSA